LLLVNALSTMFLRCMSGMTFELGGRATMMRACGQWRRHHLLGVEKLGPSELSKELSKSKRTQLSASCEMNLGDVYI